MPTYQYACTEPECGHQFEAVQSFSDPTLSDCPSCEGRLRKVFSAVGVVFKGSGFYRTDSRAASTKAENGDGAAPAKTEGTPSGSSSTGSSSSRSTSSSSSASSASSASSTASGARTAAAS